MPNWCSNNLTVTGDRDALREFYQGVKESRVDGDPSFLESFMPVPTELDSEHVRDYTDEEKDELAAKYGTWDWYTWSLTNWGCKWPDSNTHIYHNIDSEAEGVDATMNMRTLTAHFQTPWAPPEPAFKAISAMFPKLTFVLSFSEEGMGFYGATCFIEGEVAGEAGGDCSDIPGMDALTNSADGEYDYDAISELLTEALERAEALVRI